MNVCRWIGAGRFSSVFSIALPTLLLTLLVVGCGSHNRKPPPPVDVPIPPGGPVVPGGRPIVPGGSRPDAMDTSADPAISSPSIMERRTQAYSKSMEAAIDKRQSVKPDTAASPDAQLAAAQAPPSAPPTAKPSEVQFLDPSANRLSLFPGGLEPATIKPPAIPPASIEDSSKANAPAAIDNSAQSSGRLPGDEPATENHPVQMAFVPPQTVAAPRDGIAATNVDSLDHRLAQRVRDYPHDVSAHLDYELSRFVTDQPVPDLATLSVLPSEDSEMLAAVLDGLSNFRNNLRADANMLMSKKVAPLLDAAERLRSRAGLTIGTVCLCTEVKTFGVYTPFPGDPPQFSAGMKHPILVYVEVTNFSSELRSDKQWQTDLPFSLMLYSEQGMPEWKENRQSKPDTSHTRRHDFFFVQPATLQPNLPPGKHLLKITVEDTQAHRFAESTIPLNIEADPATP